MKGSSWIYQCVFPLTYSPGNRVSLSLTGLRQSVRRTVLWKKYLPPSQFLSFFFILSHLNLTLMIWNKFVKWCFYFKWRFWGDSYFSHMVRDFCIAFFFKEIKSSFKNNILCILCFLCFCIRKSKEGNTLQHWRRRFCMTSLDILTDVKKRRRRRKNIS